MLPMVSLTPSRYFSFSTYASPTPPVTKANNAWLVLRTCAETFYISSTPSSTTKARSRWVDKTSNLSSQKPPGADYRSIRILANENLLDANCVRLDDEHVIAASDSVESWKYITW
ncbi:hypothetical protein GB937_000115 [Aspergillus fischeri]|nr:hypothetical protein GB937_000115 [Aspergillus fischeri]